MPKPVKKKKRFIDRKSSSSFALVHRSQRDPLAADSTAPQRVLQPIKEDGEDLDELERRREEQHNYGVYFDDDYNYLQHLRQPGEAETEWAEINRLAPDSADLVVAGGGRKGSIAKSTLSSASTASTSIRLPSSVFASDFEEDVGLLNRAAPRSGPIVDADPELLEVLETLDDAFEVEEVVKGDDLAKELNAEEGNPDELDDILADIVSGERVEDSDEEYETVEEDDEEDVDSDFGPGIGSDDEAEQIGGRRPLFDKVETRTKFTEYSMSSSVISRSQQLTILDDRFEKFFDKYEEENTGALEFDDIEGVRPEASAVMDHMVAEFQKEKATERQRLVLHTTTYEAGEEGDGDREETELLEVEAPKEKWDCESIISTYSNLYHHPKLISEPSRKQSPIKISGKTGMPKDVLGKGLTARALRQLDFETGYSREMAEDDSRTLASRVSALSIRNKHETLQEKRDRKKAFKELKRERRQEKKCNKLAFKEEEARQHQTAMNRKNVQGQKIL